jgi:hypothetical protein
MRMLRSKFIGTVLVIVLGVNLGAWTLSVATNPSAPVTSVSVPISASAIDARSQAASAELSRAPVPAAAAIDATGTTTVASTSAQGY